MNSIVCAISVALCAISLAAAEPAVPAKPLLHPLFSDEAVLQRDKPVAVWGWAAPEATVTVVLTGGSSKATPTSVQAGADGRWRASIGPFPAGGPYTLSASSGTARTEAKDVLVGDVWLCGGQSNMEFPVKDANDYAAEKSKADLPQIRHLAVARNNAGTPQELITGQWKVCAPDTVGAFTAVGFFMARKLNADLKVPIGLVHSSWGGTTAEAWTSAAKLATIPDFAKPLADFQNLAAQTAEQQARTGKDYPALISEWYQANDPGTAATPTWFTTDLNDQTWNPVTLPAVLDHSGDAAGPSHGTVWVRRRFTLSETDAAKHAALKLGRIYDCDATWVNGRKVGETEGGATMRSYGLPAALLKAGENTIAIRLLAFGAVCGFTRGAEDLRLAFDDGTNLPLAGEWRMQSGVELTKATPLPLRLDREQAVTSLYNGMLNPLLPLSLTGIAWYQGEANASRAYQYRTLLPAMIADWRARFGQGDLPFLIVSLANYTERKDEPGISAWAELREAQAMTARSIAKGGLALAIDVGDAGNIHPKNKQEVGRRLALAAEAIAYGKDLEWSGPWFQAMTIAGSTIRLSFDHLGGGLVTSDGAAPTGFAIAGDDKTFVWAEARIDGDAVVVTSPRIAKPVAVRYAWANNPACNLANRAGLPAVPFRTDEWMISTQAKALTPTIPGR